MTADVHIFTGVRLTGDPESIVTKSGNPMAKFAVALSRGKDSAIYPEFKVFGELATKVLTELKKGSRITVLGSRLDISSWTDKETGATRKSHEYILDNYVHEYTAPVTAGIAQEADVLPEPTYVKRPVAPASAGFRTGSINNPGSRAATAYADDDEYSGELPF